MSNVKVISTGYHPRPLQAQIHRALKRFNVLCCHRRFGKTHLVLNEIVDKGLRNTLKNPQYAYIAPTYGAAKRIAWDLIKDYCKDLPNVQFNEAELRVDIPRPERGDRIRFMLLGAENPGSIRGIYLDGVVLDEYAEMNPEIWSQVLRPALSDRMGWGIFIGTPKGTNHFYDIYKAAQNQEDWFTAIYKASETGVIPITELEAAKAVMSENEYEQEYECSFSAALVGAYYGQQMEKLRSTRRICGVPYDPAVPVYTAWDLGIDDTTVVWFAQVVGKEIHIIDYIEESGQGLDFYARQIKEKGYFYEEHLLPHDAAARELGTGKTREETLRSLGLKRTRIVPRQSIEDGINAVRVMLRKCWIDAGNCERGIKALENYERKWDSKNKMFIQKPLHNWASNGADGFRTLAMGLNEERASMSMDERVSRLPRQTESYYDPFGGS